jgi:hypothetical protein
MTLLCCAKTQPQLNGKSIVFLLLQKPLRLVFTLVPQRQVLHVGLNSNALTLTLPSGELLPTIEDFKYLGINIYHPDSVFEERCKVAWKACCALKCIFHSNVQDDVKVKCFRSLVEPVLLYGLECVPVTKCRGAHMDAAHRRLIRYALAIHYSKTIKNEVLHLNYGVPCLTDQLWKKRLTLLAQCLRTDMD